MRHADRFALVAILILAAATVACQRGADGGPEPAATQAEVVEVGVILGLTGNYSQYGKRMKAGYDLAIEALEGQDRRYRIELSVEDSKFDPQTAVQAYQQMRNLGGIELFAGVTGSKNAAAVCSSAASEPVLILDPLSSAPSLTDTCGQNYFRIMASDALAGRHNVDWALERGLQNLAIVHVLDDWGNSYTSQIGRYLQEKGLEPVLVEGVSPGERDYSAVIRKLDASARGGPDGLFLLLYGKDAAAFMQQLRTKNTAVQVFGSDNLSTDEFLAAGADVVEGTAIVLPAPAESPTYAALEAAYEQKYGDAAPEGVKYDINVTKSYDALLLLAEAIDAVGPEPAAVQAYLENLEGYQSVSGPVSFDQNGDIETVEYERYEFKNGERVPATG